MKSNHSNKWSIKYISSSVNGVDFIIENYDIWFEVIDVDDTIPPVIESIEMDIEDGAILKVGQEVNLKVKVVDDGALKLYGNIEFKTSINIDNLYICTDLSYVMDNFNDGFISCGRIDV